MKGADTSLIPGWVVPGIGEVGELANRVGFGFWLEIGRARCSGLPEKTPSVPPERATSPDAAHEPSPNQGRIFREGLIGE